MGKPGVAAARTRPHRRTMRVSGLAAALLVIASLPVGAQSAPAAAGTEAPGIPAAGQGGGGPGRGPVTSLPLPRYVSMRADSANARRGPGLDQRVDWEFLKRGLPLRITAEYGQWRRVEDAEGAGGWVHQALLSGTRTGLLLGTAPVTMRAGPEESAATRAMAEPGVIARIERCAGPWCEVAVDGFSGWVPRSALWGVDPEEVID